MKANEDILELIKRSMVSVDKDKTKSLGVDQVALGASLASLGIDSIVALEMSAFIEDELNVRFPDEQLARLTHIDDLVGLIERYTNPSKTAEEAR
jgi:acyl carrier protein